VEAVNQIPARAAALTEKVERAIPPGVRSRLACALATLPLLLVSYPVSGLRAEPARWVPVGHSVVAFDAQHPLGAFSGEAEPLGGEVRMDPADLKQGVTGWITFQVRSLKTGVAGRDRDMWRALAADRHPEIRYTIEGLDASFGSLSDRSDIAITVKGTLQIAGVDRAVPFSSRARLREDRIWVRGDSSVQISSFGIPPPRRLFMKVREDVALRFDILLERSPR